ncbi:MAG TPA: ATP-binding protein [Acidobacteriota bacterium]|nr:ATP-binding protein [Acidobacteriota bacterium]
MSSRDLKYAGESEGRKKSNRSESDRGRTRAVEDELKKKNELLTRMRAELRRAKDRLKLARIELQSYKKAHHAANEAFKKRNLQMQRRETIQDREIPGASEALDFERRRLHGILDALPAYIALLTTDRSVLFANRFFRKRFGDYEGKKCHECLQRRAEPCETCMLEELLRGKEVKWRECEGPDGRHYEVHNYLIADSDGSRLVLEVGIDNTETIKARDELSVAKEELEARVRERTSALTESEARLVRAQEIAHLGSWELDMASGELTWSDEVYRIFGAEQREFAATYEAFLERVHPDDRALTDAAYVRSLHEKREGYEHEHRVIRKKTGEIRWIHEKCLHFRDESGRVIRSIGMVLDITERKRVEEDLERSMRRFELLSRTAGDLLKSTNPAKAIPALCHRVMEHLDCHVFFNFLVEENSGGLRLNAGGGLPNGKEQSTKWTDHDMGISGVVVCRGKPLVLENVDAGGDECLAHLHAQGIRAYACLPLLAAEGRVLGTLSFGTCSRETFSRDDLSLMNAVADQVSVALIRIQGEQALHRAADELARSNKDLEQFAYVSSHDLREPLRTVTGFMQLLQQRYRGKLDEKADEYIRFAVEGAGRMQQLIDDLLSYSRVGSSIAFEPQDTRELLDRALGFLKGSLEASGAGIHAGNLPVVHGDGVLLTQVFQNLIENAIKFRSDRPLEIHVGARRGADDWLFWVKDNGIGMDREHIERVFVIFKRLHTREQYPGTGIGLAICEKIIERHGGRIWAESEPGRGSTFFFTLPCGPE